MSRAFWIVSSYSLFWKSHDRLFCISQKAHHCLHIRLFDSWSVIQQSMRELLLTTCLFGGSALDWNPMEGLLRVRWHTVIASISVADCEVLLPQLRKSLGVSAQPCTWVLFYATAAHCETCWSATAFWAQDQTQKIPPFSSFQLHVFSGHLTPFFSCYLDDWNSTLQIIVNTQWLV